MSFGFLNLWQVCVCICLYNQNLAVIFGQKLLWLMDLHPVWKYSWSYFETLDSWILLALKFIHQLAKSYYLLALAFSGSKIKIFFGIYPQVLEKWKSGVGRILRRFGRKCSDHGNMWTSRLEREHKFCHEVSVCHVLVLPYVILMFPHLVMSTTFLVYSVTEAQENLAKIRTSLNDLVAADCVLCGIVMIELVFLLFELFAVLKPNAMKSIYLLDKKLQVSCCEGLIRFCIQWILQYKCFWVSCREMVK